MDRPATMGEASREFAANVAHLNPEKCPCHGNGWILSPFDAWEKCRFHFHGQAHPEDFDSDEPKATTPPDPAAVAACAMALYGALVCILADLEAIGHVGPKTRAQAVEALLAAHSPIEASVSILNKALNEKDTKP